MKEKKCNQQRVTDGEPGEPKLQISRNDSILKLRDALRLIELVALDYESSSDYSKQLAKLDSLIREVITQHLIFPEGLQQFGPLLSCVSCGRLLFDGREELLGDVLGDSPDSLPVGLE